MGGLGACKALGEISGYPRATLDYRVAGLGEKCRLSRFCDFGLPGSAG